MEDGGWRMEDGGWRMGIHRQRFESLWETKRIRAIDHSREHRAGSLPAIIFRSMFLRLQVSTVQSIVQPRLRLHRLAKRLIDLVDKRRFITASRPSLRNHRAHRA